MLAALIDDRCVFGFVGQDGLCRFLHLDGPGGLPAVPMDGVGFGWHVERQLIVPAAIRKTAIGDTVGVGDERERCRLTRFEMLPIGLGRRTHDVETSIAKSRHAAAAFGTELKLIVAMP